MEAITDGLPIASLVKTEGVLIALNALSIPLTTNKNDRKVLLERFKCRTHDILGSSLGQSDGGMRLAQQLANSPRKA